MLPYVFVEIEMGRWCSPLMSITPFGLAFSRHEGLSIQCNFFEDRRSEAIALRSFDVFNFVSETATVGLHCQSAYH